MLPHRPYVFVCVYLRFILETTKTIRIRNDKGKDQDDCTSVQTQRYLPMNMKPCDRPIGKIVTLFFILICGPFLTCAVAEDRLEIPSSPNPVGSGARALGMGGAFIAVADDATAASWNPAGLIQLRRPEMSIVGEGIHRIESIAFDDHRVTGADQTVSKNRLNYFSVTSPPFSICKRRVNMIFSLNYQHLYDFKREWNLSEKRLLKSDFGDYEQQIDYDWRSDGSLSALGLACSFRIRQLPQCAFGFTLNIWEDWLDKNEWEVEDVSRVSTTPVENISTISGVGRTARAMTFKHVDRYSFSGLNANIGFLWDVNGSIKLGAVLKTPFKADIKKSYTGPENSSDEDMIMEMPMSYGIGVAWRVSDKFTASLDVYRTEWDDFVLTDRSKNEKRSPITGDLLEESDIDPTHQVRLGAEYLFIWPKFIIPLCWGAFYDPAPAPGSPDDFFGFTIGSGISSMDWKEPKAGVFRGFTFDIAYQYRFGNDVGSYMLKNWEFSQDVREHTVYSSLIIYF